VKLFGPGNRIVFDSRTWRKAGCRSVSVSCSSTLRDMADLHQMGRKGLQGQRAAQALSTSRRGGVGAVEAAEGQQRKLKEEGRQPVYPSRLAWLSPSGASARPTRFELGP
jgi:hypothetical protein